MTGRVESHDTYAPQIVRAGLFRVILCRDGIQWIIQRQKSAAAGRWRSLHYCQTRKALLRLWPTSELPSEEIAAASLAVLGTPPERVGARG